MSPQSWSTYQLDSLNCGVARFAVAWVSGAAGTLTCQHSGSQVYFAFFDGTADDLIQIENAQETQFTASRGTGHDMQLKRDVAMFP